MCKSVSGSVYQACHYVYVTRNKVNGKQYIGKHTCRYNVCSYMGSGTQLRHAFKKYGLDNFEVVSRTYFNKESNAYQYEALLVTQEIVKSDQYYNAVLGGAGHAGYRHTGETSKKLSEAGKRRYSDPEARAAHKLKCKGNNKGAKKTPEQLQNLSRAHIGQVSWCKGLEPPTHTCPHCNKTGKGHVMFRHHFDRCKTINP